MDERYCLIFKAYQKKTLPKLFRLVKVNQSNYIMKTL